MKIGKLSKFRTWMLLEAIGHILTCLLGVTCYLWIDSLGDDTKTFSGYIPLTFLFLKITVFVVNFPLEERIKRVSRRLKERETRLHAGIPLNSNITFKWSKSAIVVYVSMLVAMMFSLLMMGRFNLETDQFYSVYQLIETVGWYSFGLLIFWGAFMFVLTAPTLTTSSWMKVEIQE